MSPIDETDVALQSKVDLYVTEDAQKAQHPPDACLKLKRLQSLPAFCPVGAEQGQKVALVRREVVTVQKRSCSFEKLVFAMESDGLREWQMQGRFDFED